jgi:hypothetical protein
MEIELTLVWAIIVTITLGIIMAFLFKLQKRHDQDIRYKETELQELAKKLDMRQTKSYQAGVSTTSGDYAQILGEFSLLSKYDSIITLSTTSLQPSLDLIGINEESLDFLELKKKGAGSSKNENHVKRLVDEKKVSYKIFDIDLPDDFSMNERIPKQSKQKEKPSTEPISMVSTIKKKINYIVEAQKKYPSAFKLWTDSDDEFLKNYWKDESNKKSKDEKIEELMQKFDRSVGGIKSRLKKLGLDYFDYPTNNRFRRV